MAPISTVRDWFKRQHDRYNSSTCSFSSSACTHRHQSTSSFTPTDSCASYTSAHNRPPTPIVGDYPLHHCRTVKKMSSHSSFVQKAKRVVRGRTCSSSSTSSSSTSSSRLQQLDLKPATMASSSVPSLPALPFQPASRVMMVSNPSTSWSTALPTTTPHHQHHSHPLKRTCSTQDQLLQQRDSQRRHISAATSSTCSSSLPRQSRNRQAHGQRQQQPQKCPQGLFRTLTARFGTLTDTLPVSESVAQEYARTIKALWQMVEEEELSQRMADASTPAEREWIILHNTTFYQHQQQHQHSQDHNQSNNRKGVRSFNDPSMTSMSRSSSHQSNGHHYHQPPGEHYPRTSHYTHSDYFSNYNDNSTLVKELWRGAYDDVPLPPLTSSLACDTFGVPSHQQRHTLLSESASVSASDSDASSTRSSRTSLYLAQLTGRNRSEVLPSTATFAQEGDDDEEEEDGVVIATARKVAVRDSWIQAQAGSVECGKRLSAVAAAAATANSASAGSL